MNVFSFYGRVGRLEWWFLNIFSILIVGIGIAIILIHFFTEQEAEYLLDSSDSALHVILSIISIPMTWICFATNAKRFHDLDRSGWWQLIWFIPLIGPLLILIVLGFIAGELGDNDYGSPGNGSMFASSNGVFGESSGSGGAGPTGYFDTDDDPIPSRLGRSNTTQQNRAKSNKPVFGKRSYDPPLQP